MGKFVTGTLTGGLLSGALLWGWYQQQLVTCHDRCGAGTVCIEGRCELAPAEPAAEDDAPRKKKRTKTRKKRRARGSAGGEGVKDAQVPDGHVPRFNPTKSKTIDAGTGSERLSDNVINRELAKLDGKFQACIAAAARASEAELAPARVSYEFGIAPSGKVTGVNVRAPAQLKSLGVVSCVRVAIFGHRFPGFDGLEMGARSSFSI